MGTLAEVEQGTCPYPELLFRAISASRYASLCHRSQASLCRPACAFASLSKGHGARSVISMVAPVEAGAAKPIL